MNTRKITPGCLCIIIRHPRDELNGIFVRTVRFIGDAMCKCGCWRYNRNAWQIEICHGTVTDHLGVEKKQTRIAAQYLLPIPGDMPPPESLQHRKPTPELIEGEASQP